MVKTQDNYKAVLDMSGKIYKAKGNTTKEALNNIPIDFVQIKTKGTITISEGDRSVNKFFYLGPLRKLFVNKLKRELVAIEFDKLLNAI